MTASPRALAMPLPATLGETFSNTVSGFSRRLSLRIGTLMVALGVAALRAMLPLVAV